MFPYEQEGTLTNAVVLKGIWENSGTGIDIRNDDLEMFIRDRPIHLTLKEGTLSPTGAIFILNNLMIMITPLVSSIFCNENG